MALKTSTGLRNHMMGVGSFKSAMDGAELRIFAGATPASADDDCTAATLLCTIYEDGDPMTPLHWEATAAGGVLPKLSSEFWSGTVSASGTASFFRIVLPADTNAASATDNRVQGDIGLVASDLNLSSLALTVGASQIIDSFSMMLPTY